MKRAVIVVDMLHEFVEGRLGGPKAEAIVPAVNDVIDFARASGWPVAYACDDHYEDDPEIAVWGEHAMHGSYGSRLAADVAHPNYQRVLAATRVEDELPAEDIFAKRAYSAFEHARLEPWLRQRLVLPRDQRGPGKPADAELVLVGTATHICVAQTAIDAFQRGFKVAVVSDATCGFPDTDEQAWLQHITQLTGAWTPSAEVLRRTLKEAE